MKTALRGRFPRILETVFLWGAVLALGGCPPAAEVYRVTYDGNGHTAGNPPVDPREYLRTERAEIMDRPPGMEKNGLGFSGWRWRDSGGHDYFQRPGDFLLMSQDYTLYASWQGDTPFAFEENSEGLTVTGASGEAFPNNQLVIPDKLPGKDGKPVTRVGNNAFANRSLTELDLSRAVKLSHIGEGAFSSNRLEHLSVPPSVREIGGGAFQQNSLSGLNLGAGLETIGPNAFSENRLSRVFLPAGLKVVEEGAFNKNPIDTVEIGDTVDIKSETSLGDHGTEFRRHYSGRGKAAGVYLYVNGSWSGPYKK